MSLMFGIPSKDPYKMHFILCIGLGPVVILACKYWWDKERFTVYVLMHASKATTQLNTKQYINCAIMVTNGTHKLLGPT